MGRRRHHRRIDATSPTTYTIHMYTYIHHHNEAKPLANLTHLFIFGADNLTKFIFLCLSVATIHMPTQLRCRAYSSFSQTERTTFRTFLGTQNNVKSSDRRPDTCVAGKNVRSVNYGYYECSTRSVWHRNRLSEKRKRNVSAKRTENSRWPGIRNVCEDLNYDSCVKCEHLFFSLGFFFLFHFSLHPSPI